MGFGTTDSPQLCLSFLNEVSVIREDVRTRTLLGCRDQNLIWQPASDPDSKHLTETCR
jgi:hypothetical protein